MNHTTDQQLISKLFNFCIQTTLVPSQLEYSFEIPSTQLQDKFSLRVCWGGNNVPANGDVVLIRCDVDKFGNEIQSFVASQNFNALVTAKALGIDFVNFSADNLTPSRLIFRNLTDKECTVQFYVDVLNTPFSQGR